MLNRFSGRYARNGTESSARPPIAGIGGSTSTLAVPPEEATLRKQRFLDAKVKLHRQLIEEINLAAIEKLPKHQLQKQVSELVSELVLSDRLPLNAKELEDFSAEVYDEMMGLGPVEPLLKDPDVTDILINTHEQIYVERLGQLERSPMRFRDEAHLLRILNKIVSAVGRRVDESQPRKCSNQTLGGRRTTGINPQIFQAAILSATVSRGRRPSATNRSPSCCGSQGASFDPHLWGNGKR
jgi:pilus assembly protein CpaF